MTYSLQGMERNAKIIACELVNDDPDYPLEHYVWTIQFETPVELYDGSLMYKTYLRRFAPAQLEDCPA